MLTIILDAHSPQFDRLYTYWSVDDSRPDHYSVKDESMPVYWDDFLVSYLLYETA